MAEVSRSLLAEIQELETQFSVSPAKLKEITAHFQKELERGLSVEGGSIVSSSCIYTCTCMRAFLMPLNH